MKNSKKTIITLIIFAFVFNFIALGFVYVGHAQADPATTGAVISQTVGQVLRWVKDGWKFLRDKVLAQAAAVAYKNALKAFLSRMAYDTAVWISEGAPGQGPLFVTEGWGDFAQSAMETALIDSLDVLASENGFFEFDVCQPFDVNFSMSILLTQFKERNPYDLEEFRPRCTWSEMKSRWTDWRTSLAQSFESDQEFFDSVKDAFRPTQQDVGIALKVDESITSKIQDKKTQQFLSRLENQGLSPVTEPITGFIKTPAKFIGKKADDSQENIHWSEKTYTGQVVADAMGIFTNTLMARLMQNWLADATGGKQAAESQASFGFTQTTGGMSPTQVAQQQAFAGLAEVSFSSGQENVIDYLSACPDPASPGPTDCAVAPGVVTAISNRLTVKEAIDQGALNGNWIVGWENDTQPAFNSGYPYRSLVIMRTHRIIPVGWELAAWYAKMAGLNVTLNELIDCFEDPRPDLSPNNIPYYDDPAYPEDCRGTLSYNPYYHLVDPNWVLKAPETFCNRKGSGFEIVGEELACAADNVPETCDKDNILCTPTTPDEWVDYPACDANDFINPDIPVTLVNRNSEYCADWQSCLEDDEDGTCLGNYGYCLKEKELWQFEGESCPAQLASCLTLSRQDNEQFSYLTNTLKECFDQSDAGCNWYALTQEKVGAPTSSWEWLIQEEDSRIYLNSQAQACETDSIGCTKLGRMMPGMNTVLNGDFAFDDLIDTAPDSFPLNWEEDTSGATCNYYYLENDREVKIEATSVGGASHCTLQNSGFIPINTDFTYQLSYKIKADTDVQAAIVILQYDEDKLLCDGSHPAPCSILNGTQVFENVFDLPDEYTYYSYQIGPDSPGGYDFLDGAKYAKVGIMGPHGWGAIGNLWIDDVQLRIVNSPIVQHNTPGFENSPESYTTNYSQTTNPNHSQHLKLASDYYECELYNNLLLQYSDEETCENASYYWRSDISFCVEGGDEMCSEFATYCEEQEIGCEGYSPTNGDPEVPAKLAMDDACPAECVGYDNYIELNSWFEETECPMYSQIECGTKAGCAWVAGSCVAQEDQRLFIPETAQICSVADSGCEEFTNMDDVAQGGEGLEYFTYLRQCISPDHPDLGYYYTWEGSDTEGYQLKKWTFLQSNITNFTFNLMTSPPQVNFSEDGKAPCTNITIGTEVCTDSPTSFNYYPGVTNPTGNQPQVCAQEDIDAGDYDCRDFFNAEGHHFYRRQSQAVTASSSCHPYRRTATGQIYNADPTEGTGCSAASNNCREYKGNAGNNIRVVLNDDFESGTSENWGYYAGDLGPGAQISNESIVQGGHSLNVYNTHNTTGKTVTDQVTIGKEYTISFWAKKYYNTANIAKFTGDTPLPGTLYPLHFSTNLTNIWQYYELGPVKIEDSASGKAILINIDITGLGLFDGFYVDNIVFKEFTDNFYVIRNSWQTPVACDNSLDNPFGLATCPVPPVVGSPGLCTANQGGIEYSCTIEATQTSCQAGGLRFNIGAQQGCQQYLDREYNNYYLKKFSYLCNDTAIGCEAYIDTQNSTDYQGEHTFGNFVCDDVVGEIVPSSCTNASVKGVGNYCCLIRGQEMCRLNSTDESCEYDEYPPGPPASVPGNTIPNDEIVYLVNDPEKACSAQMQGCMQLGQPELNHQIGDLNDPEYVVSTETVIKINNPDDYDETLCSPTGEFCTQYQSGSQTSYYYDPQSTTTEGQTTQTCFYDESANIWKKSGTDDACPNQFTNYITNISYLPRSTDYNYEGWAGLCDQENSGCTMYLDPEDPLIDEVNECEASIVPQFSGVCDATNGILINVGSGANLHTYCQLTINNLDHFVCLVPAGASSCEYQSTGWFCDISYLATGATECCLGGQTPECDNEPAEIKACTVYSSNDRCYYNLQCTPYNYLEDTVSSQGCNGLVDKEKGCVLFNDTSLATLNWSSESSLDNDAPAICDPARSILYNDDCDSNKLIKVRKDRQCAEWLACGSSYIDPTGEEMCLDLIRCSGVGESGQSCTNIIPSNPNPEELFVDLSSMNPDEANSIRMLSGYSHAGAKWSSSIEVAGYYSPEDMIQIGNPVALTNGSMESIAGLDELPNGWDPNDRTTPYPNIFCNNKEVDYNNPHSGMYAAKLIMSSDALEWVLNNDSTYCGMQNDNGGSYYIVDPDQRYSLELWMRSQNGSQRGSYQLAYYDGDGNICNDANNRCDPDNLCPGSGCVNQWGGSGPSDFYVPQDWTRYTTTFGPVDDTSCDDPVTGPIEYCTDKRIPPLARKVKVSVYGPKVSSTFGQTGFVLVDDVKFEPILKINDDALVNKECRLFAKENSPSCSYRDIVDYQGWNGYCLEPDPFALYNSDPLNPTDIQTCLQWYPVESLAGDSMVFNIEYSGYTGPDNLYYCAQSQGLTYTGYSPTGPGCFTRGNMVQSHISFEEDQDDCTDNIVSWDRCNNDGNPPINQQRTINCHGDDHCVTNHESWMNALTTNFRLCLDIDDEPAWTINRSSLPAFDQNIKLSDLEGIYVEAIVASGGWTDDASGWMTSSGINPVEYYFDSWWNDEGIHFWIRFDPINDWITEVVIDGDDNTNDGGVVFNVLYLLKEPCETIVQTVSDTNEKVWLERYDSGWDSYTGPTWTTTTANILGYNRYLPSGQPYWGTFGSINAPASGNPPDTWGNEPYYIGMDSSQNAGLPFAVTNQPTSNLLSSTDYGGTCIFSIDPDKIGADCVTNSDCDVTGVCGGIGKYCFITEQGDDYGISTGQRCASDADCDGTEECRAIGHTYNPSIDPNSTARLYEPDEVEAIDRVQHLFAQVFGVWQWSDTLDQYQECGPPDYCGIPIIFDRSEEYGDLPVISGLSIDNQIEGDISLDLPGEEVSFVFNTDVPNNQLPIEEIKINWNDGSDYIQAGPFSDKPPGSSIPHSYNHTYTCSPDITGTRCALCSDGTPANLAGQCIYPGPAVNIRDGWDWCANGSLLTGVTCGADEGAAYGDFDNNNVYDIPGVSPYSIIVGP